MRTDLLRVYKTVHTWTGVICGLALFICFYAGAVTMFKDSLTDWVTPPASARQLISVDDAPRLIDQVLAAEPAARRMLSLHFQDRKHAWLVWPAGRGSQRATATLDARVHLRVATSRPSDVASFIDVLHMTAGVPGSFNVGMGVMGVISLLYGLALVSGVVLLPTLIRDLFMLRVRTPASADSESVLRSTSRRFGRDELARRDAVEAIERNVVTGQLETANHEDLGKIAEAESRPNIRVMGE